jgi:dimethylargininase
MQIAITREVSRSIERCELTYLARERIDLQRARQQHAQYEQALRDAGLAVLSLPEEAALPDSVFVEDTALVLDECAIVLRPGAASRLREAELIGSWLRHFRTLYDIQAPASVDGGDILCLGRTLYLGVGQRTNHNALEQLLACVAPLGYGVVAVPTSGCLHLKSAATEVAQGVVLANPEWVDPGVFRDVMIMEVDPSEPYGANALRLGEQVLYPEACPRTRARLEQAGIRMRAIAADELAKAEGALTCCSLIFRV